MHSHDKKPIDGLSFSELDALREELRLPQVKLCQRCDLNPTTYTRWRKWARGEEGGSRPHPRSLRVVREALKGEIERHAAVVHAAE